MSTATPEPSTESPPSVDQSQVPVLIGLTELVELFEGSVAKQTIYRWRTNSGGRKVALPEPFRTVSRTPMWLEETVLTFAASRGIDVDEKVLRRIRREQGH